MLPFTGHWLLMNRPGNLLVDNLDLFQLIHWPTISSGAQQPPNMQLLGHTSIPMALLRCHPSKLVPSIGSSVISSDRVQCIYWTGLIPSVSTSKPKMKGHCSHWHGFLGKPIWTRTTMRAFCLHRVQFCEFGHNLTFFFSVTYDLFLSTDT